MDVCLSDLGSKISLLSLTEVFLYLFRYKEAEDTRLAFRSMKVLMVEGQ